MSGFRGFLGFGDAVGEALKFGAIEDFGVDHANQKGLDGALAKPVDDAFYGAAGDALAGLGRKVKKGAVFNGMSEIAFFFKTAEDGADGGVLERTSRRGRASSSRTCSAVTEPRRQTMERMVRSSSPSSAGSCLEGVLLAIVLLTVTHKMG